MPDARALLEAALDLAARGWPVFPCHPNDKRPLVKDGLYAASADPEQIRTWWKRWPEAMIGLPTGSAIGAWVIDIDPKDGATPGEVLELIAEAVGETMPLTPVVRTPRGGLHLYLAMPAEGGIGNRAGVIPGVDVRGDGGYVIAPPSVRHGPKAEQEGCEGVAYAWETYDSLADLDPPAPSEALLRFVAEKHGGAEERPAAAGPIAPAQLRDERVRRYAISALEAETRAVAECRQGGRNQALNRAAYSLGQLVGAGVLGEGVVVAALEEAAAACGLTKDDGLRSVRATLRSGLTDGRAAPRDLSEVAARAGAAAGRAPEPPWPEQDPAGDPAPRRGAKCAGSHTERGEPQGGDGGGGGSPPGGGAGSADGEEPDPEVVQACVWEPQNDTGNARRMMAHFGGDLLNVREVGQHYWTGTHWEAQGGGEAWIRRAQATAERIALEADYQRPSRAEAGLIEAAEGLAERRQADLSEEERKTLRAGGEAKERLARRQGDRRRYAVTSGNSNKIAGMIAQAMPHMTVPPDAMDADPLVINLRNGTLRLVKETREEEDPDCPDPDAVRRVVVTRWRVSLDAHSREDRIAKVMPVEYDPAAACPKWEASMQRFQPKEAVREFLRRFHGYALTGLMGEQVFLYNYGLGANFKSTFMEAIARLMGPYAQVLPAEALTGDSQRRGDQATPEYARLPGARLVRCAELPRGQGFRENTLKMLTGGEAMLVRHLHARFFELRPTFKAIGSGNDRPQIGGVDEGIWRRMKLVPWGVTIPLAERRPMEKVLAEFWLERAGILNWLLQGLVDYLEGGLDAPAEIQAATDSYRADMDPVGEFTRACVVPMPEHDETARDMYQAYVAWCHANSVKAFAERTFATIMVQKGYTKENGRIRKYKNVVLQDVPEDPEAADKYSRDRGGWA